MISEHLVTWNMRTIRSWSPLYFLTGERLEQNPFPPYEVSIEVTFDDNDAALEFERKIRKILEDVS